MTTATSFANNDLIAGTTTGTIDTVYTASAGLSQITQATAYNKNGSAVNLTIYILTSSGTAGTDNILDVISIPAGGSRILTKLVGHHVPSQGTVKMYAGTTNVISVTISGVVYS